MNWLSTFEFLIEVLIKFGVPGFIGSLATLYVKDKISEKKELRKQQALNAVISIGDIYSNVFNPLMELPEVNSVAFFLIEDSGKILNPLSPIFITALAEHKDRGMLSLTDNIVKWRTDDHHNKILAEMCRIGNTTIDINTLHKESKLYSLYKANMVTYAEKYLAGVAPDGSKIYYMTIMTTTPDERFENPKVRATINFCVNEIQNIVLKHTSKKNN